MMPCYNTVAYIKAAIESVQNQTYEDWELLIQDDGSTDGSYELANALAQNDDRILVGRNEVNRGINRTRQILANLATGDLIGHLDSDDMLERWAVEEMVNAFKSRPDTMLIYSDMVQVGVKNDVECYSASPTYDSAKLYQHGWRHFGMYRAKVFDHIQGFNDKIAIVKTCEDGDLFMQIAEKFPIYRLQKALYMYRNRGDNTSSQKPDCEKCPAKVDCNYIRVWTKSLNKKEQANESNT
jgi:glycosyltransferase involved in cell wall biosynthesis